MMEHNYRSLKEFKPYVTVLTLVLVILFSFPALSWSRSKRLNRGNRLQDTQNHHNKMRSKDRNDFTFLDETLGLHAFEQKEFIPVSNKKL